MPLAFLDYLAGAALPEERIEAIVEGVARGCERHQMDLAGGETAEMPGLYSQGEFDLAGTIVGVVEEGKAIHGTGIQPGHVLIGYESTGLHTNGYSLARRIVFEELRLEARRSPRRDGSLGGRCAPHGPSQLFRRRSPVLDRVSGLAHITGGGIPGNLVRVLPEGIEAVIDPGSWTLPPVFRFLGEAGGVSPEEMREVFNLGVGFIAVAPPEAVEAIQDAAEQAGVRSWVLGTVRAGTRGVRFG